MIFRYVNMNGSFKTTRTSEPDCRMLSSDFRNSPTSRESWIATTIPFAAARFLGGIKFKPGIGAAGVPKNSRAPGFRFDFLDELKTLRGHIRYNGNKSGQIAAWARQACRQTKFDKIADTGRYNRNG